MKDFREVAQIYTELAQLHMVNRAKPAYKTGNLYNTVGSYNTPDRVLSQRNNKRTRQGYQVPSVKLVLSFSPPGARYGKYVEKGTRYMDARPFAEEAANDSKLNKAIIEAGWGMVNNDLLPQIRKDIDKAFKKMLS
jgi:hypothetical protein